ncbi:MAG TPA: signal peptide peptidase SppA [Nevskiales bacterium]|nr:signal peptide peptidase SppA [Nevskiales bacterium]
MSSSRSWIVRLFAGIWQVIEIVRRVLVTLVVLALVLALWLLLSGRPEWTVEDNVALVWVPLGTLVEMVDEPPETALLQRVFGERPRQTRVRDLIKALDYAATDPRIKLVFLKLDELEDAGMAQLQELGAALQQFRKRSGKKLVAYAPAYSQPAYYLAAQADEVYLDPMGFVLMAGFGHYGMYFKEALDKLGVDMHVFRVGEYKSAVEPFERNDMSPEAKVANAAWLQVLWEHYKAGIAAPRKLAPDAIENYAANLPAVVEAHQGDLARAAKEAKLVDGLLTLQQVREKVGAIVGMDEDIDSFRQIDHFTYLSVVDRPRYAPDTPAVGLVVAQGELIDGESVVGMTGADTLADLIGQALQDEQIAALVLRVDSPGGSITAAETIRRQVSRFRESGRPVVVSMSNLAASGGYWIAAPADQIWAQDTTLTGSIGVFGLVPTLDRSLAKLGIRVDGVGTTPMAGALRIDRPMSPDVARAIQLTVEKDYRQFIEQVAKGRRMNAEAVDRLARGRVWSGLDARRLGLVDQAGGLQAAIEAAVELAGLDADNYRLEVIEPQRDFASSLIERLSSGLARLGLRQLALPEGLQQIAQRYELQAAMRWLNDPSGVYSHCFCRPSIGGR